MKSLNLCLHAGGSEVAFADLMNVRTPSATDTWHPIPHHDLVNRVRVGLNNANLEIVKETHALAKEGNRYFGIFQIAKQGMQASDYSLVMGLRNSHDKTFPAGITAGSGVFVCDNLAFSGEVKLARKHTINLNRDLPGKISEGIGRLGQLWVNNERRFDAYKNTRLDDSKDVHDLLIRAIDCEACTVTQVKHILDEYRKPSHEEFQTPSVWRLFNAFTEKYKGNLEALAPRSIKLHGLLDAYCGIIDKDAIALN